MVFSIFTVTLPHAAAGGGARSQKLWTNALRLSKEKLGVQSATLHT